MRNGTADVSKTISHDQMLPTLQILIDITVNNYNLPRSLKGGVRAPVQWYAKVHFYCLVLSEQ